MPDLLTFFNACYQVQFQKWILGPKMPQSAQFGHTKFFP